MARRRKRVRLEDGLKLDLNKLFRDGIAEEGEVRRRLICWTRTATCETVASGIVETELRTDGDGWLTLKVGELYQAIKLRGAPRHYGGRQWYALCPELWCKVSVLWLPPSANRFLSRQACGRAAYTSQFETPHDRGFSQSEKIRRRLCGKHGASSDDAIGRKPKGMHWRTYEALLDRWEAYELKCNLHFIRAVARLEHRRI